MCDQPAQDLGPMVDGERRSEQDTQDVIRRARQGVQGEREQGAEEHPGVGHCGRFCYGSVTWVQFPVSPPL